MDGQGQVLGVIAAVILGKVALQIPGHAGSVVVGAFRGGAVGAHQAGTKAQAQYQYGTGGHGGERAPSRDSAADFLLRRGAYSVHHTGGKALGSRFFALQTGHSLIVGAAGGAVFHMGKHRGTLALRQFAGAQCVDAVKITSHDFPPLLFLRRRWGQKGSLFGSKFLAIVFLPGSGGI